MDRACTRPGCVRAGGSPAPSRPCDGLASNWRCAATRWQASASAGSHSCASGRLLAESHAPRDLPYERWGPAVLVPRQARLSREGRRTRHCPREQFVARAPRSPLFCAALAYPQSGNGPQPRYLQWTGGSLLRWLAVVLSHPECRSGEHWKARPRCHSALRHACKAVTIRRKERGILAFL